MFGQQMNPDDPYSPTMKANAPVADQQRNGMQTPQVLSQPVNWNVVNGWKQMAANVPLLGAFENIIGEQQPPPGRNLQDV